MAGLPVFVVGALAFEDTLFVVDGVPVWLPCKKESSVCEAICAFSAVLISSVFFGVAVSVDAVVVEAGVEVLCAKVDVAGVLDDAILNVNTCTIIGKRI